MSGFGGRLRERWRRVFLTCATCRPVAGPSEVLAAAPRESASPLPPKQSAAIVVIMAPVLPNSLATFNIKRFRLRGRPCPRL